MNPQRSHPIRSLPVFLAFIFNLVIGPMAPLAQQAITRAANDGIDSYQQCQIGNPNAGLDCDSWINGILNATHNNYAEDEVVPQRLVMTFASTGEHSVDITYLTRKDSGSQHHAYDSLATWNYTYVNALKVSRPERGRPGNVANLDAGHSIRPQRRGPGRAAADIEP